MNMKFMKQSTILFATTLSLTACLSVTPPTDGALPSPTPVEDGDNGKQETPVEPTPVVSPTPEPTPIPPVIVLPPVEEEEFESFTINNGEEFTNSPTVMIHIKKLGVAKYRVTMGQTCSTTGTWINVLEVFPRQLPNQNAVNYISVQFLDLDDGESECYTKWIAHDNQAPVIQLSLINSLNSYLPQSSTHLSLNVVDRGIGLQQMNCLLNEVATSCQLPTTVLSNQNPGNYVFKVIATDKLNQTSENKVQWTIKEPLKKTELSIVVEPKNKVDILFVIDNSGSMGYEQQNMASRVKDFISIISVLDWQIGVTTTDTTHSTLGDGRLLNLTGLTNKQILNSSYSIDNAQKILGDTLQRKEIGSSFEQGIYVSVRAIERGLSANNPNTALFRQNADLAIVVISDEDESARNNKNKPEYLLSLVKTTWPEKNFTFHSIITRPGDVDCKNDQGAAYGTVYDKMSRLTGFGTTGGSIIGSVCATDYTTQLKGISNSVKDMQKTITLTCLPKGDLQKDIKISKDGSIFNEAYVIQQDKLVFTNALSPGNYNLEYLCE